MHVSAWLLLVFTLIATAPPTASAESTYRVRKGDTLGEIAQRHDISVRNLRAWNGLRGSRIYAGQRLRVAAPKPTPTKPASPTPAAASSTTPATYTVQDNDTLVKIALRFDVAPALLRSLNELGQRPVTPGQTLRLRVDGPKPASKPAVGEMAQSASNSIPKSAPKPAPAATHTVRKGETLWNIAQQHKCSVKKLKQANGRNSNRIYVGQVLKLPATATSTAASSTTATSTAKAAPKPTPPKVHLVRSGDTLGKIAQANRTTVAAIRKLNGVRGSRIYPGQKLTVQAGVAPNWLRPEDIDWETLRMVPQAAKPVLAENGPYYYQRPQAGVQRNRGYFEGTKVSPRPAYDRAKKLWREFERKVDAMGRLSDDLAGWHIVIDPGHGGQDPGAIVKTRDGNGKTLYVVEDEYVYDIALRVYTLLSMHGADATLTLLSPNHLLRGNQPATRTFVNEKNEVYNLVSVNKTNRSSSWPRGGRTGLNRRVEVATQAFAKVPVQRRIFLSLHADNAPKSPSAPQVLYYSRRGTVDSRSRRFAQQLLPRLGEGARTKGQSLGVLRNNPAHVKVLVELRNLAFTDNAWALRFEALRQQDAERLVQGVLDYVRGTGLVAR